MNTSTPSPLTLRERQAAIVYARTSSLVDVSRELNVSLQAAEAYIHIVAQKLQVTPSVIGLALKEDGE